jgi:hypothetical protein
MENPLNYSRLAFPLLQSFHLLGIVLGVGSAAQVNLRLLSPKLSDASPSKLWGSMLLWSIGGLTVAIFTGLMLFSIAPEDYIDNPIFRWKIGLLLAAIVFYYTLVRRSAVRDQPVSTMTRIVAAVSLLLFALVPLGGILIGYE